MHFFSPVVVALLCASDAIAAPSSAVRAPSQTPAELAALGSATEQVTGHAAWQLLTEGKLAIRRRAPHSFSWREVSPPELAGVAKGHPDVSFWADVVALSAIDAKEAWVAMIPSQTDFAVSIAHTTDGGKHWQALKTPARADGVKMSFVDSHCGFLLALGSPSAGLMKEEVYGTTDGGAHWQPLTAPAQGGCYPTGICFRTVQEGWITATYHGAPDAPLFHTLNGGQSWHVQALPIPAAFQGGYADVYPPIFHPQSINPKLKKGQLPVKLVRHEPAPDHQAWLYFHTEDGGITWHLPPAVKDQP